MALWLNLIPQLHQPGDPEISMRHHHFKEREPQFYAGKLLMRMFKCEKHEICMVWRKRRKS
jgi:hypothetical protein